MSSQIVSRHLFFRDAASSRPDGVADHGDATMTALMLLLLGHVIVWTLQPYLARNNLASFDMVENWNWGREWQLGYWKHPPFFAWVTGAWFDVFPRVDWAYYLLSATNSALGIAGIWAMTGEVDDVPRRRLLAAAAMSISPLYGALAVKFNANAVLLAVWPWASWAFLRALRVPTIANGAVLGLLLAIAMLSKYTSLVLVAGMIAVVLADRRRWAIIRSPAAIAATLVGGLAFAPHLYWMMSTHFRTITYAEQNHARSMGEFLIYFLRLVARLAAYLAPMIVVVLVALPRATWPDWRQILSWQASDEERRRMLLLAGVPFATFAAVGLLAGLRFSSEWGFPLMFTASWLLASAPGIDARRIRLDRAAVLVGLLWASVLVAAPAMNVFDTRWRHTPLDAPYSELGAEVTRLWRAQAGGRPLKVVAGSFELASNTAFYSPDSPSMLIDFKWSRSPWVTPERIRREGVAVVCPVSDEFQCVERARAVLDIDAPAQDISLAKTWYGIPLTPHRYLLLLRPPHDASRRDAPPAR